MSDCDALRLNAVRLRKLAEMPYRLNVAEKALMLDAALDLEAAAVIAQPPLSDDRQRAAFMAGYAACLADEADPQDYPRPGEAYTAWLATQPKETP